MPYIILLAIVIFLIFYLKRTVPKNYVKVKKWIYKYQKQVIGVLLVIGLIWFRTYTIVLIACCLIYYFYCKFMREKRVEEWEKKNIEPIEYKELDKNIEKIAKLIAFNDKNKSDYKFSSSNMPYGRVNAFMNYFQRDLINEDIYYFSAVPSENENEIREYGLAVTGSGIFIASQANSKKGKTKEILFSGLNKAEYDTDTDTLLVENIVRYGSGAEKTKVRGNEITVPLTCIANALIGKGAVIYTITMQVSRGKVWNYALGKSVDSPMNKVSEEVAKKINSKIVKSSVGKKLNLQDVTGQELVSGAVTVAVVFGPDVCRACMGKISVKQLAKNATAGAAGIAGMAVGSAITGGNPLGGMVGGAVGGAVGKKVMDNFIEDDAIAMFRVMKEEFINVVMSSYLTQEEFEEVAKRTIWNKKVSKELQNMYKKSKSGEHRTYANSLIEEAVIDVLKKRRKITNEMWIEGQQLMGA